MWKTPFHKPGHILWTTQVYDFLQIIYLLLYITTHRQPNLQDYDLLIIVELRLGGNKCHL